MFHRLKHTLSLIISVVLLGQTNVRAQFQWTIDGIPIALATANQVHLNAVSDGNGGIFIAYEDNPMGDTDIYAQWIDGSGNLLWGPSGVVVSSAAGDQNSPGILPDGSGGVFIAWEDKSSNNIYAQHLDANGSALWTPGGIAVCTAPEEQYRIKMASDNEGGAILVWVDKRKGPTSDTDLYAQRIDGSGSFLWTTNGVPVSTAGGNQSSHAIISDGSGGIFAAWQDYRDGNYDIYAQRLTPSGTQAWTTNGVAVVTLSGNQFSLAADTSGNKLIISWDDYRSGNSDIYAQALDPDGNPLWTINGIPVSTATGAQMSSRLVHDGAGGTIITWVDNRIGYDIYAQRIDGTGNTHWIADGIPINQSTGYQYAPEIVSDGSMGCFVVWNDNRTGSDIDLYAQHVTGDGALLWPDEGLPVVSADNTQQNHVVLPDGSGGALTLWQDGRDGRSDIYAQLMNDNISFIVPTSDTLWTGGQSQTIQWTLRTPETRFDHLTLRLSTSPGDGFPQTIAQDVNPLQYTQSWTPTSINSSTVRIKIQSHNAQDSILCEYESDAFTVDSNPPDNFDLLSPPDGSTVDLQPTFQWESTTDNLSGLDYYELWIGETRVKDSLLTTSYTLSEAEKLTPGESTWTVKAVDKAGLVRQALNTWTFTAIEDNTPPAPFHLLSPIHNTWTTDTNPPFAWETSTDNGSGLLKYQLYLNGQLRIDNISPSTTSTSTLTLTPGDHYWYVVAVDSFQNSQTSEETWTIRMDNVPPYAFSLIGPQDDAWTQDPTPTFTWQATSDTLIGIGLAEYQLWIDSELAVDHIHGDSISMTLPPGQALEENTHSWTVVAKDSLENSRTSKETFTLKIDTTPPSAFNPISPEDGSYVTTESPNFSWQSTTDTGSGLKEYELWIDGTRNVDGLPSTSSPPASPLTEGNHTWAVRAEDNVGNIATTPTFSFVADSTPPEPFELVGPLENDTLHINQPLFTWRSTTDLVSGFDKFQFFVDGQIERDDLSAQDTTTTLSRILENGIHTWKVLAWDKAGNVRSSENPSFIIDCNPPQITSPGTATATEDVLFTYTATATDPDGDTPIIALKDTPTWLTPSGNVISGTPTEGTQDTSFVITATDGIFTDSLKVILTVQAVNDPPVITSSSTATATEHEPFTYTATATDPEEDELTFSFDNHPPWLTPSGNRISGTPPESAQDTSFTVTANDGSLTDTLNVSLTVIPVNDPPIITSPDTAHATENVPFVYRATATDVDGPHLTVSFIEYPAWFSPSGPEISGTPPKGTPNATFKVVASDGDLSDTLTVTLIVTQVNDPPVFDYPLPQPQFVNIDTLRWDIPLDDHASDPDDPDSTLGWSYLLLDDQNLSVSITNDTHIATIFGVDIQDDFRIVFIVTDPHDASATDTLKVTIITTGVESQKIAEAPDDFILHNNYPNPFNPFTTIRYGIPHPCHVTLRVYNMLGREVATLIDEKQQEGTYEILWDASDAPSGVYFYRIQTEKWQNVRRMILIK